MRLWRLTSLSTIFQLYRGGQFLLVEETGVPGENSCGITIRLILFFFYNILKVKTFDRSVNCKQFFFLY